MTDPVDVERELDALYAGPLEGFLDARKALVAKLKKLGKRDTAARVGAAPKPTAPAWAVNTLYRTAPESFAALLDLGESLRSAQVASLSNNASAAVVVEIQKDVRTSAKELAGKAKALLEEAKLSASAATLEKVTVSLERIATTGSWGDSSPGRLVRELEAAGIDAMTDLLAAALSGSPAPKPTAAPVARIVAAPIIAAPTEDPAAREARTAAEKRLGEARAELEQAKREEKARFDEREAARRAGEAARGALTDAESTLVKAKGALEAAQRAVSTAEGDVGRARDAVSAADARSASAASAHGAAGERSRAAEAAASEAELELAKLPR